jgi:hypothetical protein
VSDVPEGLDLERHRDRRGIERRRQWRTLLLALMVAVPVLALFDVFGQRPAQSHVDAAAASLELNAPTALRGGLMYEVHVVVKARRRLAEPKLVFDSGWFDNLTVNAIEPAASSETFRREGIVLAYDALPAGGRLDVRLNFQVNPTAVGDRAGIVALDDGESRIARVRQPFRVYP